MDKISLINAKICTECGGDCCKSMPGIMHPDDVGIVTKENILKLLKTGNYNIDWWEDNVPIYYLRPATTLSIGRIRDPSWGGQCVFLTNKGCSFSEHKRPKGCLNLVPNPQYKEKGCKDVDGHTKYHHSRWWLDYQHIFVDIIRET